MDAEQASETPFINPFLPSQKLSCNSSNVSFFFFLTEQTLRLSIPCPKRCPRKPTTGLTRPPTRDISLLSPSHHLRQYLAPTKTTNPPLHPPFRMSYIGPPLIPQTQPKQFQWLNSPVPIQFCFTQRYHYSRMNCTIMDRRGF